LLLPSVHPQNSTIKPKSLPTPVPILSASIHHSSAITKPCPKPAAHQLPVPPNKPNQPSSPPSYSITSMASSPNHFNQTSATIQFTVIIITRINHAKPVFSKTTPLPWTRVHCPSRHLEPVLSLIPSMVAPPSLTAAATSKHEPVLCSTQSVAGVDPSTSASASFDAAIHQATPSVPLSAV
jgi:hypothetical protein